MKKAILVIILSLILSITVWGAETRDGFTYEIDELNGLIITGCSITDARIEIPAKIGARYVKSISDTAFENCPNVQYIFIPAFVKTIDENTFNNLDNLKAIYVNSANKYYSNDKFGVLYNKHMTTLIQYPPGNESQIFTLPENIYIILPNALNYCPFLNGIRVPKINKFFSTDENNVLFNKNQTELIRYPMGKTDTVYTIPESVTDISIGAFANCNNLEQIQTDSPEFVSLSGVLFSADMETLIKYPAAKSGDTYTVPEGVKYIAERAFEDNKHLKKITMPESLIP